MTGTEIYKRTAAYERESGTIRLHAPQWKLLLAFDGRGSLAEVAQGTAIPLAEALPFTEEFLKRNWLEEQPMTLDQYLKRANAPSLAAISKPADSSPSTPLPAAEKSTPSPTPGQPPTSPRLPLRVSAVVDYLISFAENHSLGQFLVYRVFLRVPPGLLQAEDIASVHLMGDSSLIRGEALQQAIAKAVQEVTHRPLPDNVLAPA